MDFLLIIVIILLILWFTGWRGIWGRRGSSNRGLINIILILAVIILVFWLLKAVLNLF